MRAYHMQQPENKQPSKAKPTSLGEFIREQRRAKHISQDQLAERSAIHRTYLSRLELGQYRRPSREVLQRIARVLEVDYRDLYALCGYDAPEGLPSFVPYLRAKYPMLDDQAVWQLNEYFAALKLTRGITDNEAPPRPSVDQSLPDLF
jgi:transcriptional regulator with XRE-family HTH domain